MKTSNIKIKNPAIVFVLFLFISFSATGQHERDLLKEKLFGETSSPVLVAAHRAAHHLAPENSLKAIEDAIKMGADIIEIDVRITKDGIPVLLHDETIDRTTNGTGRVIDFTLEELRKFNLKYGHNAISDMAIPTLEEALKLALGKILVDLDLKLTEIVPVIETVKRTGTQKQVFFFDGDYKVLKKIRKIDRELYLMPRAYSFNQVKKALRMFDPPIVHIDNGFYIPEVVSYIQKHGARIWINALGDQDKFLRSGKQDELLEFLQTGADVIQTDEPEVMIRTLRTSELHH